MSLSEELSSTVEVVKGSLPPRIFAAIGQSIADLRATGIESRAAGIGARIAAPTLVGLDVVSVNLGENTKGRPFVLIFYRGGWCPYCNVTLKAYARLEPAFRDAGAAIFAVTPELPARARTTVETNGVGFPVLVDEGNRFARSLGLVFDLPASLRPRYREIGIDLPDWNGDDSHELPVPAVYVVDRDGVIRFAHVEADFTTRAEPEAVLSAVRGLRS